MDALSLAGLICLAFWSIEVVVYLAAIRWSRESPTDPRA